MSSLTRWVLAHKRIVVLFWLALTVIGMGSVNKASQAMNQPSGVKISSKGESRWSTRR